MQLKNDHSITSSNENLPEEIFQSKQQANYSTRIIKPSSTYQTQLQNIRKRNYDFSLESSDADQNHYRTQQRPKYNKDPVEHKASNSLNIPQSKSASNSLGKYLQKNKRNVMVPSNNQPPPLSQVNIKLIKEYSNQISPNYSVQNVDQEFPTDYEQRCHQQNNRSKKDYTKDKKLVQKQALAVESTPVNVSLSKQKNSEVNTLNSSHQNLPSTLSRLSNYSQQNKLNASAYLTENNANGAHTVFNKKYSEIYSSQQQRVRESHEVKEQIQNVAADIAVKIKRVRSGSRSETPKGQSTIPKNPKKQQNQRNNPPAAVSNDQFSAEILQQMQQTNDQLLVQIQQIREEFDGQSSNHDKLLQVKEKELEQVRQECTNLRQQTYALKTKVEHVNNQLLKKPSTENIPNKTKMDMTHKIHSLENQINKNIEEHAEIIRTQIEEMEYKDLKLSELDQLLEGHDQKTIELETKILHLKKENAHLKRETMCLEQKLITQNNYSQSINGLKLQLQSVQQELQVTKQDKLQLIENNRFSKQGIEEYEAIFQQSQQSIEDLTQECQTLTSQKAQLETSNREQNLQILSLQHSVQSYQHKCQLFDILTTEKQKMSEQLGKMDDHLKKKENEKDFKISLLQERLSQVNDRDKELERIFDYAYDLTRINMVYQPVEGDKIDKQLGDIINGVTGSSLTMMNSLTQSQEQVVNRAKMLFVRESPGVYTYCKKKVLIKNEQERLIIRVGGGYMSLEEFIETFNPFQQWKPKHDRQQQNNASTDSQRLLSQQQSKIMNRSHSNSKNLSSHQQLGSSRLVSNQQNQAKKQYGHMVTAIPVKTKDALQSKSSHRHGVSQSRNEVMESKGSYGPKEDYYNTSIQSVTTISHSNNVRSHQTLQNITNTCSQIQMSPGCKEEFRQNAPLPIVQRSFKVQNGSDYQSKDQLNNSKESLKRKSKNQYDPEEAKSFLESLSKEKL